MKTKMNLASKVILALDIGSVRIGLAIWRPSSQMADCLPFMKRSTLKSELSRLEKIIKDEKIEAFLVGLPIALSGNFTQSTKNAEFWIETLKNSFQLPVYSYDESLSSKRALELLKDQSSAKKKEKKDSLSAAIFLEDFIRDQTN
jgi:putative Holliday junction resolvase